MVKEKKKKKLFNRKHIKYVDASGKSYADRRVISDKYKSNEKSSLNPHKQTKLTEQEIEELDYHAAKKMFRVFGLREWHIYYFKKFEPELLIGTQYEAMLAENKPRPRRKLRRD